MIKVQGISSKGGVAITAGISSTNKLIQSYPLSTLTVYDHGTTDLAPLFTDAEGSTTKANPFVVSTDGSFGFYVASGRYDLRFSGAGITTPFTLSDITVGTPGITPADDYDSLLAAVTAIGSAPTTLVISTALFPSGGSCTVPATLILEFRGAGTLMIGTGHTVIINSDVSGWPIRKIFYNATAGLGTVSFSGNIVAKDLQVAWWGADVAAAGSATSAALNAAFVAAPFGANVYLSSTNYQHSGFTIDHKAEINVIGNASLDGHIDPGWGTRFTYVGADGGTAITLNNVYGCTFRGFLSYGAPADTVPGTTGCAKNIYLTMTAGGDPPISSQCVFQSVAIRSVGTRTDYRGLDISNASGSNNEFHSLRDCKLSGGAQGFGLQTGTGLYLGHANVKHIRIERTTFSGFNKSVESLSASFRGVMNTHDANNVIYSGVFSDAVVVIGDDSESCTSVVDLAGQNATSPFTIMGGRYSNLHGGQAVSGTTTDTPVLNADGRLLVVGCKFAPSGAAFTDDFLFCPSSTGQLLWQMNGVTISDADLVTGKNTFLYSSLFENEQNAIQAAFVLSGTNTGLSGATPDLMFGPLGQQYRARYGFNNSATPTTVTNFLNGFNGQLIILVGDAVTSIANGASIKTLSGATIPPWGSTNVLMFYLDGTVWRQISGMSGLIQGEGAALTISSNTIAPTAQIHQVGAGLIKTITLPASIVSGTVALVPTAAFTYDATGNVLGTGTAVVGRTMFATYSASTGKWSMSY